MNSVSPNGSVAAAGGGGSRRDSATPPPTSGHCAISSANQAAAAPSPGVVSRSIVIVGSALSKGDGRALQQVRRLLLAQGVRCSLGKAVQWGVTTHVVVGSNAQDANSSVRSVGSAPEEARLARRTIKYCAAVLCGTCILSAQWLHAVVAAGRAVDEAAYLIEGDHVARGAPAVARAALWGGGHCPPPRQPTPPPDRLFQGIVFLLAVDELRPSGTEEALAGLLQQGGGAVLRLAAGRPQLKRARTATATATAMEVPPPPQTPRAAVHVSDVKFPAALQGVPAWAAAAAAAAVVCGTSGVLNAVSRYSTEELLAAGGV